MKYSVKELERSPEGRKRLAEQRKKYEIDALQPSDPRFKRVYGDKIRRQEEAKAKDADRSRAAWERREWEKESKKSSSDRKQIQL